MKYDDPLKQILSRRVSHWDRDGVRPSVRTAFRKALQCRTPAVGAEVYASANQERIVYHTCKGRACPSCGHRATIQWQRQRWAMLPDVPYKAVTFTMPKLFWPIFRDNRDLAQALPALAATVIQTWARARHGLQVGVMAILHTFNGRLEFNFHVHTMVTGGGFQPASGSWLPSVHYDQLMEFWRDGVIRLLRTALRSGLLHTDLSVEQVESMLSEQEKQWWSVKIQSFDSTEHFLRYAARYVRRPPIAQRRITRIGDRNVTFWYKDKKLRRRVDVHCSLEEFIDRWAAHIPERYKHAVRSFGMFSPRALCQTSQAVFAVLGQKRRPRPKPCSWADSVQRYFGHNPLLDGEGNRMKWVRRIPGLTAS